MALHSQLAALAKVNDDKLASELQAQARAYEDRLAEADARSTQLALEKVALKAEMASLAKANEERFAAELAEADDRATGLAVEKVTLRAQLATLESKHEANKAQLAELDARATLLAVEKVALQAQLRQRSSEQVWTLLISCFSAARQGIVSIRHSLGLCAKEATSSQPGRLGRAVEQCRCQAQAGKEGSEIFSRCHCRRSSRRGSSGRSGSSTARGA